MPPQNYNVTITEVVNAIYGKNKEEAIKTFALKFEGCTANMNSRKSYADRFLKLNS